MHPNRGRRVRSWQDNNFEEKDKGGRMFSSNGQRETKSKYKDNCPIENPSNFEDTSKKKAVLVKRKFVRQNELKFYLLLQKLTAILISQQIIVESQFFQDHLQAKSLFPTANDCLLPGCGRLETEFRPISPMFSILPSWAASLDSSVSSNSSQLAAPEVPVISKTNSSLPSVLNSAEKNLQNLDAINYQNKLQTTSKAKQQQAVLCNSRCRCILFEPVGRINPKAIVANQSSDNQTNESSNTNDNNASNSFTFGEDYSVDYADYEAINNEDKDQIVVSTLAPAEAGSALMGPGSAGNERKINQTGSTVAASTNFNSSPASGGDSSSRLAAGNNFRPPAMGHNQRVEQQQPRPDLSVAINKKAMGKEPNQAQLYAQALYSSQAPKLSLHAHQALAASGSVRPEELAASRQAAPSSQQSAFASPFPMSLKSNYLAHYLRANKQQQQQSAALPTTGAPASADGSNFSSANSQAHFGHHRLPKPANFSHLNKLGNLVWPLRSLNYSKQFKAFDNLSIEFEQSSELIAVIEGMLEEIVEKEAQSLDLSRNKLQFDLWSELYAILAANFRLQLYHLDLSHNSLIKLGVTFTGYLEHHLASHNNSWPIKNNTLAAGASQSPLAASGSVATATTTTIINNESGPIIKSALVKSMLVSKPNKHMLLSGGKLYGVIQKHLANLTGTQTAFRAPTPTGSVHKHLLQQPVQLRALDLSYNKLKWLINDQFRMLKLVQSIRLDHNEIRYIHQHAFSGLESLRFLNLNFNKLQVIYIEQFQTNYNLLALMMQSNSLAYVSGGSFASLSNLKRLDLSRNKLTIMSSNAFIGLESLEVLNCSSNSLLHSPSASLHSLTSLKLLDLSKNLFNKLAPGTFFHLPLEELSLNENEQLVSIDRGTFWDLPYLRRVNLRFNPILASIDSQAFVGTYNLQTIDVEGCPSLDRMMLENLTLNSAPHSSSRVEKLLPPAVGFAQQASDGVNGFKLQPKSQVSNLTINSTTSAAVEATATTVEAAAAANMSPHRLPSNSIQFDNSGLLLQNTQNQLNFAYYLGTMALLVVALKIVFTYTSSKHYLNYRRRRRRIYEATSMKSIDQHHQTSQGAERASLNCSSSCQNSLPEDNDGPSISLSSSSIIINNNGNDGSSLGNSNEESYQMCDIQATNLTGVIFNVEGKLSAETSSPGVCESVLVDQPSSGEIDYSLLEVIDLNCDQQNQDWSSQQEEDVNNYLVSEGENGDDNQMSACCPNCPGNVILTDHIELKSQDVESSDQQQQQVLENGEHNLNDLGHLNNQQPSNVSCASNGSTNDNNNSLAYNSIQRQLVEAGLDYGHANCAHFYQSLGPAMQFADMTANFMHDYY